MTASAWSFDQRAARARAPQQGSSRLGDAFGDLRCERLGLSPGLAVCRVEGRCDRAMSFEAPGIDEPRVHLQFLARGTCDLLDARAEHRIAAVAPTLFRPPGGSVAWRVAEQPRLHVISIDVSASALQRWCDSARAEASLFDRGRPAIALAAEQIAVYDRLQALLSTDAQPDPLRALRCEALVLQALAGSLEQLGVGPDGGAPPSADARMLRRVRELLRDAPAPPVTLMALARTVGMPLRRLQRLYAASEGRSLREALQDARFEAARRALLRGELSIKQIAWQAGFAHPTSFTHAFRARYGCTPSMLSSRASASADAVRSSHTASPGRG